MEESQQVVISEHVWIIGGKRIFRRHVLSYWAEGNTFMAVAVNGEAFSAVFEGEGGEVKAAKAVTKADNLSIIDDIDGI
jgi:hypothetical protein